ncbi:MAG: M13 family metallopeptidase [Maricaulaceae bacterium]|nr:M13 family metallopeptidase [Maricaulaceae bacterium]
MRKLLLGGAIAALLAACNPATDAPPADVAAVDPFAAQGEAQLGDWGVETAHISETVAPGDDFFTYVNEGWLNTAEMPAGFSRFGAFTELFLEAEQRVNAIIQESGDAGAPAGDPRQQIGDLFSSYLDTDRIEALGLSPIQEQLDALLAMDSHEDVARWMARPGTSSLMGLYVGQDSGNPQRYLVHLSQSGLGLPNKDYYERDDEPFPSHRAAYADYIAATLARAGVDDAEQRGRDVLELETRIAANHWTREQQRDRVANYNLMTRDELEAFAPAFPWAAFFEERDVAGIEEVVVNANTAVQANADLFAETPVETWRSYMAFHWINNHAGLLPEVYERANWEFFSHRLNGVAEQRPRDLRAIQFVNGRLGELIGQVYVERHFPPEYRDMMMELVEYLRRAFAERLSTLDWMDDETRAEAQAKLEAFLPKIGYPDRWRDYTSVAITTDDLVGNIRRLGEWSWADSVSRLNEPRREWEWFMSPQTVNAYYSPANNEIVFPAAILQPPFFDPFADPAVNFGAIGGVIGHEMGHGFDDQGSRSDAHGVLRNWWTEYSREQFEARTSTLVAQYSSFEPLPGMNLRGAVGLGENIGDLGGLSIAMHAYQMYLNDHHGGEAPVLDGFTGEQRLFLAWGQVWRNLQTEEALRAQIIQGPHSPAMYRVNGVVRNIDAWYEAFGVGPEHELYLPPEDRVSIW